MPKKGKFSIGGAIVTLTVIGAALFRKGGAKDEKEFENGLGNGNGLIRPDDMIRLCINSGGTWSEQFQRCETFNRCGPRPTIPPIQGFYYRVGQNFFGWAENRRGRNGVPALGTVVFEGGFNPKMLGWIRCRVTAGLDLFFQLDPRGLEVLN